MSVDMKQIATDQTPQSRSWLAGLFRNQVVSMLAILAIMWALLGVLSPYFFTVQNLFEITLQTAVIAIIGAGMTFVILSGGIDLSVGSVFACSAVVGGLVFANTGNFPLALLATVAFGALLGLVNGTLITQLRVPPFIATLGMMGIARGFALIFSKGIPIYGLDERYKFIGQGKFFDVIPVPYRDRVRCVRARLDAGEPHAIRTLHLCRRQQRRGCPSFGHQC